MQLLTVSGVQAQQAGGSVDTVKKCEHLALYHAYAAVNFSRFARACRHTHVGSRPAFLATPELNPQGQMFIPIAAMVIRKVLDDAAKPVSFCALCGPANVRLFHGRAMKYAYADATGGNSQATTGAGKSARKLEEETEDFTGMFTASCTCRQGDAGKQIPELVGVLYIDFCEYCLLFGLPLRTGSQFCLGKEAGVEVRFLLRTGDCGACAVERVNTELKKQILQARTGAKMTQAQLAKVFFLSS